MEKTSCWGLNAAGFANDKPDSLYLIFLQDQCCFLLKGRLKVWKALLIVKLRFSPQELLTNFWRIAASFLVHENNFSFLVLCFCVQIVLQDRQHSHCNIASLLSAVAACASALSVTFVTYSQNQLSIMLQTPNDSRLLATCVSPSGMKVVSGGCHITFVYIVGNFWRLIHNLHKIIQRYSDDTSQKEAFPTKLHVFFEIMQWCFRKCKLTADFRGNATMISCW